MLLISRTESKLIAASEEVAKKYNVQTKYTVVDFANADEATWRRTTTVMTSLDVGLLINNVGLSYDHAEYFELLSDQDIKNMVEVNITSINQVSVYITQPLDLLICSLQPYVGMHNGHWH